MLLAVLVYAIGAARGRAQPRRLPVGVPGPRRRRRRPSFLTGDLFNLFVAFEMMLTASYVLLTLGGRLEQVRSGMTYVVISLRRLDRCSSSRWRCIYAATGTVNMADLAGAHRRAARPACARRFAVLLLVVFGIKAALFPLFFWLPDSYPTAPSPVTAIFAGLLTKVGVYAIIRTQTLLFPADTRPATLLLVVAGATMVVGVLGAIAQDDIRRILSFHIISQIGYMIMGLGLFTVAGLAGAVFSIVHHIVVKTALFLVGGLIEHAGGSSRLSRLGGMVRTAPVARRAVPPAGARAWPASRRSPASSPSSRWSTPAPRVDAVGDRRRRRRRQPAHAVLDDQDLDRRVLEPAEERRDRAGAVRGAARPAARR